MSDVNNGAVIAELQKRTALAEATGSLFRRQAKWSIACAAVVCVVTVVGVGVLATSFPLERYIYVQDAKPVCEAQLLREPNLATSTVLDFAKECTLEMDSFSHDTVEKNFTRVAQKCFTPGFRKIFFEAPWLNDRVTTVKDGLLTVSSETTGASLVESEGDTQQGYRWVVQIPVKRYFRQGQSIKGSDSKVYRVEVYRVTRNAYNPVGLGINSIVERSQR